MSDTYIHVKPAIEAQFQKCMERGRVLFFSAPCGFGKTVTAEKLIRQTGEKYRSVSGDRVPFEQLIEDPNWKILFVDDLQMMQEEKDLQALCSLIRENPDRRFILASRGLPPGCLMAFQYTGLMSVLHADVLLFDREDIRKLFQEWEVPVTDSELSGVTKESIGHPLGVVITIRHMAEGQTFGPELVAGAFRARIVSGDPRVGEMLDWLQRNTTMLRYDETQRFHFWPQFRAFLMWEMDREYPEEKKKTLYSRGGMYYELKEDFVHAMDCYIRGGDHSKVSELLIRSAELHPGMGHYYEMKKYYHSLPEKEILASPALMQAMSMLCAMEMDYEKSEQWYEALKQFAEQCDRMDAGGRQARSRLAWLDISLPQREVSGLTDTIPAVFRLLRGKEITLPPFSVTSTLPSIMNGGKDFSDWSKKDDMLYQVLRIPVEAVLGKDGVGLADCAIAESKFEKGEDITHRMLSLVQRAGEIQRNGTPDIEFAVTGLLIRSQMASGRSDDAVRTMEQLRTRFAENGLDRFLPNMDAMRCRMDLYVGDLDRADDWYREKAPRDLMKLNVMKRYQYLTQAMVELAAGKNQDVLLTLSSLELYCRTCRRHLDSIHLLIIRAIACWREKDKTWKTYLDEALDIAEEYQFIRPVSGYGAAVLPLLEECSRDDQNKWYLRLMAAVREQAAYYPAFLQPRTAPGESLTATELQILRLICADKSNAEIGKIMDIKLPTVKTHVSHILDKLGVSRRSEAKTAAKKRWLIPDHL